MKESRFDPVGELFDLADGLEGLIGLSFLRQFNYLVRSREGRMLVERAA